MTTPAILRQVEAYWEGLRPYNDVPSRAQVNPRGLADALDRSFLLEISQTGEPVFRLSGDRLSDILGIPLERVPFAALFAKECQTHVRNALLGVFALPSILRAKAEAEQSLMRPALSAHLLILPLRHDDGSISRALGVLHLDGALGKTPRLFTRFHHSNSRVALTNAIASTAQPTAPAGMAESGATFQHKNGRSKSFKRPNLKLIDGGRS